MAPAYGLNEPSQPSTPVSQRPFLAVLSLWLLLRDRLYQSTLLTICSINRNTDESLIDAGLILLLSIGLLLSVALKLLYLRRLLYLPTYLVLC